MWSKLNKHWFDEKTEEDMNMDQAWKIRETERRRGQASIRRNLRSGQWTRCVGWKWTALVSESIRSVNHDFTHPRLHTTPPLLCNISLLSRRLQVTTVPWSPSKVVCVCVLSSGAHCVFLKRDFPSLMCLWPEAVKVRLSCSGRMPLPEAG